MGYLGLLFNSENLSFNDKDYFVVFIEKENFDYNVIVGSEPFFKPEECNFFYLDKFYDLKDFLVFEKSKFRYGKISLSKETMVDYEGFTFWFNVNSYRKLKEYFTIDEINTNFDSVLSEKIKNILNYF